MDQLPSVAEEPAIQPNQLTSYSRRRGPREVAARQGSEHNPKSSKRRSELTWSSCSSSYYNCAQAKVKNRLAELESLIGSVPTRPREKMSELNDKIV